MQILDADSVKRARQVCRELVQRVLADGADPGLEPRKLPLGLVTIARSPDRLSGLSASTSNNSRRHTQVKDKDGDKVRAILPLYAQRP